jgi:hypothetical protein
MRQSVACVWLVLVALASAASCKSKDATGPGNAATAGAGAAGTGAMGGSGTGAAGSAGTAGSSNGGVAGDSPGGGGCGSESFAAIYQSILTSSTYNCNGPLCHGRDPAAAASVGNLSLSSATVAYTQLVNMRSNSIMCSGKTRVMPGDPKNSLLVQKLRGENTMCGAPMPVNADQITEQELKRITDWINAGACNN